MLIKAPWTQDQVDSLNAYQKSELHHEYTCDKHHVLVAHENGWICPSCTYQQNWCHDWSANWQWKQDNPLTSWV